MAYLNQHQNLIKNKYENYAEEERFSTQHQKVEFLTTMRYIQKFATRKMKILEIGAGTGAYSIELAKQGYDVTAIELVQRNLGVLLKNAQGVSNLTAQQGDALDLSRFPNNSFDMVLSFGPMYHLFCEPDRQRAIAEAIRVCKPNGIMMFAFITHAVRLWSVGVLHDELEDILPFIKADGALQSIPDKVFSSYFVDEFQAQFANLPVCHLTDVATDSIFYLMRDYVDQMSAHKYQMLLDYHYKTCERPDMLGLSCHVLSIYQKA